MTRLRSVFYGWWVVAACFALSAYVGGVYFFGILAEYFGPVFFISIVGFSQAVQQRETAIGPVFAGRGFDSTSRHPWALIIFIGAIALGSGASPWPVPR